MLHTIHLPEIKVEKQSPDEGTFVLEPLYTGFGVTLGNSLRRVLLSSLTGAAITGFKIDGVSHEFSTIDGVKEDVVDITLNLKQVRMRLFSDQPVVLQLTKKGKGVVTAGDIAKSADVEIANPKQPIATLDNAKSELKMELRVERGRGYVPVEDRTHDESEVGFISLDALYTPVKKVRYQVEHTRVGQMTNLDKLVLSIATDGTLSPEDALKEASRILVEQFSVVAGDRAGQFNGEAELPELGNDLGEELDMSIEDLALTPRTTNALINNKITTVRDLVTLTDTDLQHLKGFGSKAYEEVVAKLDDMGLR